MKNSSHILVILVSTAIAVSSCERGTPEQQFIDDAMEALGGRDRIEAARALTIEGEGVHYNLGQDMKPEAATQQFAVTSYRRHIDIAGGRQRVEQRRTPKFAYFQGPQPQTQIQGLDGTVAFNVNPQGPPGRHHHRGGPEADAEHRRRGAAAVGVVEGLPRQPR
jgi:hypothetical protein